MDNVDRNKLLLEYQKLLKRLDSAERWAIDNNFNWDDVKKYKYTNENAGEIKTYTLSKEELGKYLNERKEVKYKRCNNGECR